MGYEEDIAYVKSSMNFLTNAVVVFFCINLFIVLLVMLLFFCEVHGMINRDLPGGEIQRTQYRCSRPTQTQLI
ncbi:hypothetical protein TVAG_325160 [Trichomonas vaginalis G3]|uniref:Uncharacterized protein n=1 Tax=Trichomonas vaginalis (strain ATCC PRA-98 / G3) TaxID=412133 RepID=A2H8S3_TRIV3|nr:hypothetical protein TVAG_325160 [Trichomonas vaginalis G3]|eukprot:XP_001287124.1 hypothetical protein [Trichomonas vaginalis G3]